MCIVSEWVWFGDGNQLSEFCNFTNFLHQNQLENNVSDLFYGLGPLQEENSKSFNRPRNMLELPAKDLHIKASLCKSHLFI